MKFLQVSRNLLLAGASAAALFALPASASAADAAADSVDAAPIANSDDIVVAATKVNTSTPITASIHTFEPQAIVSRSIIEDSIAPTADYAQVILLTPGASLSPSSGNGVGLGDAKITLRGFKDGQYNITYDGVPFGDSNDPTHHSTSYFPNGTYERIIVDRGPGAATDLGQSSYGGNVHIISREATDKFFVEGEGVYGSFNTSLERLTVNSGSIQKLGDLKVIAVAEYKQTNGALTNQPGWWTNGFVKIEKPLGENAKFSILGSYNQSLFDQSDAAGGATLAQTNKFGLNYGAISAAQAAGSGYTNARNDWNWQNKTTDMEIARLQWNVASNISIDNKLYTYFYKNFTVSTEDSTTPCSTLSTVDQCSGAGYKNVKAAGPLANGGGGATIAGDVPGYTKVNQYRQWGDILQVDVRTAVGTGKVGGWFEHSQSHRYRWDYDFTTASRAGGISQYNFDFAIMNNGQNFNWKESTTNGAIPAAPTLQLNGQYVPAYIKYDEHTSWDQIQGFGEFEFKLLNDTLTITPGVKVQNFTRKIDTPIATQTSRVGLATQESYKPTLPYASINVLIRPDLSMYAQYAKGFIIPALSASLESLGANPGAPVDPAPTKTTNYQAGIVYAGDRLNIDFDGYYIQASNSTFVDPTNPGVLQFNADPAIYEGAEGQVSYVVAKGLTAIANGTIMISKDAGGQAAPLNGKWLPNAPNYTAMLGAVYSSGRFKLSYLHKFTGHQWIDAANTARLGAYSYGVLSGSVTYGRITAGVTVNNPLNSRPITSQSGAPSASTLYIYQAPASYEAQLKIRF
jgi:iron complex outermembrane receptor protein